MEKIGDIIKRVIKGIPYTGTRYLDDIDTLWYRIVDAGIGQHSYVIGVKGDILTVRVDSRCYLTEIKRREGEILSKLHESGWNKIKKIRCRIG